MRQSTSAKNNTLFQTRLRIMSLFGNVYTLTCYVNIIKLVSNTIPQATKVIPFAEIHT